MLGITLNAPLQVFLLHGADELTGTNGQRRRSAEIRRQRDTHRDGDVASRQLNVVTLHLIGARLPVCLSVKCTRTFLPINIFPSNYPSPTFSAHIRDPRKSDGKRTSEELSGENLGYISSGGICLRGMFGSPSVRPSVFFS